MFCILKFWIFFIFNPDRNHFRQLLYLKNEKALSEDQLPDSCHQIPDDK